MRVVARFLDDDAEGFKAAFVDIASRFEMDWSLRPASQRRQVVALVSKFDHCLGHLLSASRIGEIDMDVVAIISNHPKEALTIKSWLEAVLYRYFPITNVTKAEHEARSKAPIAATDADQT